MRDGRELELSRQRAEDSSSCRWTNWDCPRDRPYQLHDLLTDQTFNWQGERNFVKLDPQAIAGPRVPHGPGLTLGPAWGLIAGSVREAAMEDMDQSAADCSRCPPAIAGHHGPGSGRERTPALARGHGPADAHAALVRRQDAMRSRSCEILEAFPSRRLGTPADRASAIRRRARTRSIRCRWRFHRARRTLNGSLRPRLRWIAS